MSDEIESKHERMQREADERQERLVAAQEKGVALHAQDIALIEPRRQRALAREEVQHQAWLESVKRDELEHAARMDDMAALQIFREREARAFERIADALESIAGRKAAP